MQAKLAKIMDVLFSSILSYTCFVLFRFYCWCVAYGLGPEFVIKIVLIRTNKNAQCLVVRSKKWSSGSFPFLCLPSLTRIWCGLACTRVVFGWLAGHGTVCSAVEIPRRAEGQNSVVGLPCLRLSSFLLKGILDMASKDELSKEEKSLWLLLKKTCAWSRKPI